MRVPGDPLGFYGEPLEFPHDIARRLGRVSPPRPTRPEPPPDPPLPEDPPERPDEPYGRSPDHAHYPFLRPEKICWTIGKDLAPATPAVLRLGIACPLPAGASADPERKGGRFWELTAARPVSDGNDVAEYVLTPTNLYELAPGTYQDRVRFTIMELAPGYGRSVLLPLTLTVITRPRRPFRLALRALRRRVSSWWASSDIPEALMAVVGACALLGFPYLVMKGFGVEAALQGKQPAHVLIPLELVTLACGLMLLASFFAIPAALWFLLRTVCSSLAQALRPRRGR